MRICVFGLWHLGTVTAACMADAGHKVAALDLDATTIERLSKGEPPIEEPGLADLVKSGIAKGMLQFTTDARDALKGAKIVWVTFDTPVDDDDRADTEFVMRQMKNVLGHLDPEAVVLVSSQMPVGSIRELEASWPDTTFAYSPENLRLGKAIEAFQKPARIVVGTRSEKDRKIIEEMFEPLHAPIEWVSVESAEMTKHALNAFLATSVSFINEIAVVCERVGADAREVARALKSDPRIGQRAYLSPGGPFAGGTLARDIEFLKAQRDLPLISAVKESNDRHKQWALNVLHAIVGDLRGKTIAVWGLTYKPGTDTLRRSAAVELCVAMAGEGATVIAHDPMITALPAALSGVRLAATPEEASDGADALVVATEWPAYRAAAIRPGTLVVDANGFLGARDNVRIIAVGRPI